MVATAAVSLSDLVEQTARTKTVADRKLGDIRTVTHRLRILALNALIEAGRRMQEEMIRLGITEDELSLDFKAWRKNQNAA